jgi:Outer membrane lipoprotein carrier protein LolA-like
VFFPFARISKLLFILRQIAPLVALISALFFSPLLSAQDWKLPDLMRLLSQHKSGQAVFVEKKYIGIIERPLISSGELSFNAPDRLEKRTLKPRPESMLLEGDRLTLSQLDKRPISINLQDHPEISSIVSSIRGTLMGDLAALERSFQLSLSGSEAQWQLNLIPLQSTVAKTMQRISIRGAQADILAIYFEHADGDRSEMQISKMISQ